MNNNIKNIKEILLSDNGISNFITHLIKNMMEKLMNQELSEFLQYDKYSYEGRNSGNSRNGYYKRNYDTRYGMVLFKTLTSLEIVKVNLSNIN